MAKQISVQKTERLAEEAEPIGMENLPELPVSAKELEEILARLGAEIAHPVAADPVATIGGKVVGFWTA